MSKKRILIVDGDTKFVQPIDNLLTKEGFEVTIFNDGLKALQEANSVQYQLIILEVILPNLDGFELLKKLRPTNKTPIMIITQRNDLHEKIYGLEIGADDYLIKPVNQRELLARIYAIFRRAQILVSMRPKETPNINGISLCFSTRSVYCFGESLNLTRYEFEVLHLLMLNTGIIVSKDSIGEHVYGQTIAYNDRSIDMHICNIRKKISLLVDDQKIKTIRSAGYIFLKEAI